MTPNDIHQLIDEHDRLRDLIAKLEKSIGTESYNLLGSGDQNDLTDQLSCMRKYHRILVRRIRRLERFS